MTKPKADPAWDAFVAEIQERIARRQKGRKREAPSTSAAASPTDFEQAS